MSIDIELPSGIVLKDAARMLREKFAQYPWDRYDRDVPRHPDCVTTEDIGRANRLGARASYAVWDSLIAKDGETLNGLLAQIPMTPLEDTDLEAYRQPLVELFERVIRKHIGLAVATKALYPLRPAFLTVLDSVLENYYWFASSIRDEPLFRRLQACRWGEYTFELLALIRADIRGARTAIDEVRANIEGEPFANASRVRIVESLIWWYYAREGRAAPASGSENRSVTY